jgi:hypothetical protein
MKVAAVHLFVEDIAAARSFYADLRGDRGGRRRGDADRPTTLAARRHVFRDRVTQAS